jgi:hypothetical protein
LTFADWFEFRLIEELTYDFDVRFQEKILINDALCFIFDWAFFKAVTLSYLLIIRSLDVTKRHETVSLI